MDEYLKSGIGQIRVLIEHVESLIEAKSWLGYEKYLSGYNSLLSEIKEQGYCKGFEAILPVEERAKLAFGKAEIAKLREIEYEAKKLYEVAKQGVTNKSATNKPTFHIGLGTPISGDAPSETDVYQKIDRLKEMLIKVSTGTKIEEVNTEYQALYREVDADFERRGVENPNVYSDLWEFHASWKENSLSSWASRRAFVAKIYKSLKLNQPSVKTGSHTYVNLSRLSEIKSLRGKRFDMQRLIRYCEELNSAFSNKNYLTCGCLLRAIIDHVPPIFGKKNFTEVSNNYGGKSFKDSMRHLDESLRAISDSFLHTQIRAKENLPNEHQIDFSNDLDVLLSEICRIGSLDE